MKKVHLAFLIVVIISGFITKSSTNAGGLEEYLVFNHTSYKLKNFTFLSKNHSIGFVNSGFHQSSLVTLFNKSQLAVDSLFIDWTIENIIPENDSIFFLQSKEQTLICLIKNDELFINGIYSGVNSNPIYEKIAYYTLPLDYGELKILKKNKLSKSYTIEGAKKGFPDTMLDFKTKKSKLQLQLHSTKESYFFLIPDSGLLVKCLKNDLQLEEISLSISEGQWYFYYDCLRNESYLLSLKKRQGQLYKLTSDNKLDKIRTLNFIPEAIFNGSIHKKEISGKTYSHFLIPIENLKQEKNILLEGVTIMSDKE